MRIKIVQAPTIASIDGIQLDGYRVGREYELGTTLGGLFLAEGWAVPTDDAATATTVRAREERQIWGSHQPRVLAADRRRRIRRRTTEPRG